VKEGTMKNLILLLAALTFSCSSLQTTSTCSTESYGIIDIQNNTDEHKSVCMWRVIYDETSSKYKAVGEPYCRPIEPMVEARLRAAPGIVLIAISKVEGKVWMETLQIRACDVNVIKMKNQVVLHDIQAIMSRRGANAKLCPCPPK
jgi:hypothetical protein